MKKKEMTDAEKEDIVRHIGEMYRESRKRTIVWSQVGVIKENRQAYQKDISTISIVDAALQDCTRNTQLIIKNEFLVPSEKKWYRAFYSTSTFYRLRKVAIDEFVNCLMF